MNSAFGACRLASSEVMIYNYSPPSQLIIVKYMCVSCRFLRFFSVFPFPVKFAADLAICGRFSGISGRKHGTRPSLLRSTRKHLKTSTGSRFLSPRETYTQNPCFRWNRWRLQPRIRPPSLAISKWWATVVEWRKHSSNVKRKKLKKKKRKKGSGKAKTSGHRNTTLPSYW